MKYAADRPIFALMSRLTPVKPVILTLGLGDDFDAAIWHQFIYHCFVLRFIFDSPLAVLFAARRVKSGEAR
ncbi:hypothetical protein K0J45_18735 [Shewanella alkalitolerans]|uniref:hypothetical protein n=1 Tax=Shewanella alkalitolerans TaxID=2864209 RepID=UPI001C655B22|nr:hypothetical protein [Shewanella alkalitolerans]QYJ97506.1 hypothetical protein K0J45_18735 [Shewanella alkalitolerans]